MLSFNQKTIKKNIHFEGIGLHTGKKVNIELIPAGPNHGIIFKRIDLKSKNLINADFNNVKNALLCTTLQNEYGVSVSTIEHLMGALFGEQIDNLLIKVDSQELPIMDGSAKEFIESIRNAGIKNYEVSKRFIKVMKKIEYRSGSKFMSFEPLDNDLEINFEIIYKNKLIGTQIKQTSLYKDNIDEIYNSRTFCLYEDIEKVKSMGLGIGGSLDNAVIVKDNEILNKDGLRYQDEFVKHKILDCMGDIALANFGFFGKIKCSQGGHKITNEFLRKFFFDKKNYSIVEFKEKKVLNSPSFVKPLAATA